jgi:hypothetical protein
VTIAYEPPNIAFEAEAMALNFRLQSPKRSVRLAEIAFGDDACILTVPDILEARMNTRYVPRGLDAWNYLFGTSSLEFQGRTKGGTEVVAILHGHGPFSLRELLARCDDVDHVPWPVAPDVFHDILEGKYGTPHILDRESCVTFSRIEGEAGHFDDHLADKLLVARLGGISLAERYLRNHRSVFESAEPRLVMNECFKSVFRYGPNADGQGASVRRLRVGGICRSLPSSQTDMTTPIGYATMPRLQSYLPVKHRACTVTGIGRAFEPHQGSALDPSCYDSVPASAIERDMPELRQVRGTWLAKAKPDKHGQRTFSAQTVTPIGKRVARKGLPTRPNLTSEQIETGVNAFRPNPDGSIQHYRAEIGWSQAIVTLEKMDYENIVRMTLLGHCLDQGMDSGKLAITPGGKTTA